MYSLGFEFEILGLSVVVYAHTRSAFWAALAFGAGFAPQVVGGALLNAAIAAVLPDVLDGDRYVLGRSILSLTSSGTQILGPIQPFMIMDEARR